MNLSLISEDRAVGTRLDANGKFRRAPDYTVNTFREYLELARTHVGVFSVKMKREVAAEIAAQAESLLNVYDLSAKMSGRPYAKVLGIRIETDKWNPGYGISQIAENGAPINGFTRFDTFAKSSKDYLVFTLAFGANPKDYYQFDEAQSTRTNEDHWLTLGYSDSEAKYLSGMKLAANLGLSKENKLISRDQEVTFYEAHEEEVRQGVTLMNEFLTEERVPYKKAYYALILAKGILNKVDGQKYLDLIHNTLIDGNSDNRYEAKFARLFTTLLDHDLKEGSVWSTLRKAAEATITAKKPYDFVIVKPEEANTKDSIKFVSGAWKASEDVTKPVKKSRAKAAKAGS